MKKRIISMLLLAAMVLTMIPVFASAEEANAVVENNVEENSEVVLGDLHDWYVQDGLTALYSTFGANNGVDLTAGTWTSKVGTGAATFGVKDRWSVGENGGIGFTVLYGTVAEDGSYTTESAFNNGKNASVKLNLGNQLPTGDYTVEYLAMYKPIYVADAEGKILVVDGEKVESYDALGNNQGGCQGNPMDRFGFYTHYTYTIDGNDTAVYTTDARRGYSFVCFDNATWYAGHNSWRFRLDNATRGIFQLNDVITTYSYALDETLTVGTKKVTETTDIPVMVEKTDEEGNVVYEEDGVTPVMVEKTDEEGNIVYETREVEVEDRKITAKFNLYRGGMSYYTHSASTVGAKEATYYDPQVKTDNTLYLAASRPVDFFGVRIYNRPLSTVEMNQNRAVDILLYYGIELTEAQVADEAFKESVLAVASGYSFETDSAAKDATAKKLAVAVANAQAALDLVNLYAAPDHMTSFYTTFIDGTVNVEKGTWTDLIGGGVATMGVPSRWFVNEDGSFGYNAFVGWIDADGNANKALDAKTGGWNVNSDQAGVAALGNVPTANHAYWKNNALTFGMEKLPADDFTVEYLAMYRPYLVADASKSTADKIVYAKDADGNLLEAYDVFGTIPVNTDYGSIGGRAIDSIGHYTTITQCVDGSSGWGSSVRGTQHWLFRTHAWRQYRNWIGDGGGYKQNSGLALTGDPFKLNNVPTVYAITLDETVTEEAASGKFGLYRNGVLYNESDKIGWGSNVSGEAEPNPVYTGEYDSNCEFYLSCCQPTDFYAVRIYDKVLTEAEKKQNVAIDLILFYDLELPLDFIADEDMMADLATNVASLPFETDMMAANAVALQIEDLIQSIYQTSKIYKMYVQDGLVANYTALSPADTTASIATGAWVNRVAGGQAATMGNAKYWRRNANGSVGYDIFYGAVDADGKYTETSDYNNYTVNGTRLDLGLAQLPKDAFTVEFVAQLNPVYVADADGKIAVSNGSVVTPEGTVSIAAGEKISTLFVNPIYNKEGVFTGYSTPGSQQYGAAAYGAVYQLGYFAGFTSNRDSIHGGFTARGGIVWTTSATACNWGSSTQISGWNNSSATNPDVYTPNGSVHTYAIQRTEFDDTEAAESYRGATYVISRDMLKYAERTLTKAAMDEAKSKNASYQPVDYATDDTGYFYLGERVSIDYYAVRVYNRNLDGAEQARNHFVDIVLYYGLKLDNRVYGDEELIRASATALMGATIETDASLKAALRAQYQARLDDAVLMSEIQAGGNYDNLYVQDGLVGLYTAFAADSSIDLMNGTWNNKINNEYGAATIKGTTYWVRNPVGIGYRLSNKQFDSSAKSVGLDLPNSFENLPNFSVEAFAAVVGVTDEYGNRYVNNYWTEPVLDENGEEVKNEKGETVVIKHDREYGWYMTYTSTFRFGLLNSLFFASLDANNDSQALTQRWYLMNQAYGNSLPSAEKSEKVGYTVYNEDGSVKSFDEFDRGWNRIGKEAIVPSTMLAQKKTTGSDIFYGLFYNGSATATVEKTITAAREAELLAATDATTNRFSLFNGLPSDIYAIRVYNRELTAAEKLQNAFVDKVALYNVDITGFEDLSPDKKTALYQQFASVSTTIEDPARVQAIYNFFATGDTATMAKTLVAFEGYSPILVKGESGYRVTFSVNSDAYSLLKDVGYTVTYGALVAPGGVHNTIENVKVGTSGVKNIVVEGANGSGIHYQLAGARGYNFTAAVTADTVDELGIDVIVRGYVTLTKNGTTTIYYADATENEILDGEVSVLAATDYFVNKFDGDVITSYNYMNSAALRATLAMAGYTARTTIVDDLVLYVDAANGSDTNNGQTANTAYATIGAAFNAAKAHLGKTGRKSVVINVAAGKYHVTETMLLSKDDILADAYSFTVIGQGDDTIITSEVELDRDTLDWASDAAVVQLEADANGEYPMLRAVYADGELVPVAHYGDSENTTKTIAFRIEDASGNTLTTIGNDWTLSDADKAKAAFAVFTLPGEMFAKGALSDYVGTEIHMTIQWTSHIVHIAKLAQNNNGTVAAYVPYGELPGLNDGHNFSESCVWLQNSLPLLCEDTVYYDQANGKLYLKENNINVADLSSYTYASLTQIFKLDGVKNVTFEKLAFTGIDSKYITPDNGIACGQSAVITLHKSNRTYTTPGFQEDAAIFGKNLDGLTVKNVSVYGTLSTGVTVKGVSKNIAIDSSRFENLGGTAIQLGDPTTATKNVAITNNYVHEIGQLYKAACAINITFLANAKIIGNTVTRVPYTGISIGRIWSTVGTDANNIIQGGTYNTFNVEVAYNYVSDFMMCSKDGGAFYLLGGNIRRDVNDKTFYNFMHHNYVNLSHQTGLFNGNDNERRSTMGYYHDNSSSNWLDYENVLINTAILSNPNTYFYAYYLQDIENCEAQNVKLQDNYLIGFDTMSKLYVRPTTLNADFGIESSDYIYTSVANLKNNTAATNLGAFGTAAPKASPANASTNVAAIFAACGSSIAPAVQHQSGLSWTAPAATREILMDTERTDAGSFGKTTYTVTYKIGETTVATNHVLAGSKLSIPSMFEEAGKVYTFSVDGVAIDPATYVTPAANVTVDVLVEAQKFNVTIKDGSTTTELEVAVGETFELPAAYAKEGYVTKLTYNGNEIDLATFEMPAYDIDVRVAYELGSYTVTFTDGETTVTHKGLYKTGVPTPTQFVAPTGYKVVYSIKGVGVSVVGMTVPGKDVTVDVRYEKATYNAIFKANGKTHATVPTVYGDEIVLPAAPATYSEGGYTYTFKAWTGYTEGMTIGAENVTFEAEWTRTANDYDVKFSYTIDGVETVVATQTVTFGNVITAPALPATFDQDGYRYTFTGWKGYTEGMLLETEGATFVAVYEKTEIPQGILGDINSDGELTMADVTSLVAVISGTDAPAGVTTDLNADGELTMADVTSLVAIISGSAS